MAMITVARDYLKIRLLKFCTSKQIENFVACFGEPHEIEWDRLYHAETCIESWIKDNQNG